MVKITLDGDALQLDVQGMHKFWALKSTLRIPLADIVSVRRDPERASGPHGLRFPGTHLPGVYFAGTAYQSDRRPDFWTVHDPEKAIVIQCQDTAAYDEIIVEVEHPDHDITLITRALASR
ncbi:MAG: hypothetical protein IPK85_07985 [Gemmatimonadetes bacterium]|nr:hypothetical protein [Gemmatimonadota bacterium]